MWSFTPPSTGSQNTLDVAEQPGRLEAVADLLDQVDVPVIADRDARHQQHRVGRGLGVVLDDDLLDRVGDRCAGHEADEREREYHRPHDRDYRTPTVGEGRGISHTKWQPC